MPYGVPRDAASWVAIGLALVALVAGRHLLARPRRPFLFVSACALAAAALSAAYVVVYLRGGPRIIDATSYWLSARAMAEGHLSWPLTSPEASTMGRFLVRDGDSVAVIFPPGYPAILALGFLAGSPLVVGPLLAAGLVLATYELARLTAATLALDPTRVARTAALLSVACAALRYHTADTMSHGLAALLFTCALVATLRSIEASTRRHALAWAAGAGLAAGWLVATRPPSALALVATLALALVLEPSRSLELKRLGPVAAAAAGAIPGVLLLVMHQRAATGALFTSSQSLYYAVSDGPPGCFTYGFGAGIGCLGEHGDFVRAQLAGGFGAIEAVLTTARRLKQHLVDAGNCEPLVGLVVAGAVVGRSSRRVRLLAAGVGLVILAYAPFYFDGNYPGGGARFYADVLPLEHVLMAVAAASVAPRLAAFVVPLVLAGFALRASFDHARLRDREGGRPMFEPDVVAGVAASNALVFIDTDHGFDLAFDPDVSLGLSPGLRVARYSGDALDAMAWEAAGRPPSYRYLFAIPEGGGRARVSVVPYAPEGGGVIEGESLWPPTYQRGGHALVEHAAGTCASAGRWLALHAADAGAPVEISLALPTQLVAGPTILAPRIARKAGSTGEIRVITDGRTTHVWPIVPIDARLGDDGRSGVAFCSTLAPFALPAPSAVTLVLSASASSPDASLALDAVSVTASTPANPSENR